MKRRLVVAVLLVSMTGCASNTNIAGNARDTMFVYKPGPPAADGPKLPLKVAVLPFKDGTEDFTKRGSIFASETLFYNLAKSGISGMIPALTPDLWAKAFADEMAASGAFRAVRFVYTPSELVDEDLYIEGAVLKATATGGWVNPNEFVLELRALRRADNRPVWEKEFTRVWKLPITIYDGCRNNQCSMDRYHAEMNRAMQGMFSEARADLVATLGSAAEGREGRDAVSGRYDHAAGPGIGGADDRQTSQGEINRDANRQGATMKRLLIAALALALMAGCGVNSTFVYKPGAPAAGGPKLPLKVAVLPFRDATEDFTTRGSVFSPGGLTINLVKAGIPGTAAALTPELWAKSFADDLTASGAFQTVRFVYSPSELLDEEFFIEGTVEKAYAIGSWDKPNEIALGLRAVRRTDNRPAWEKEVTRVWTPRILGGCGIGNQCVLDQRYADINRVMQGLFAEAGADLVRTLASLPEGRAGEDGLPPAVSPGGARKGELTPAPQDTESPEQTIERIFKAK